MSEEQKEEKSDMNKWIRRNGILKDLDSLELEDLGERVSIPKWQFVLFVKRYAEYKLNMYGFLGLFLLFVFLWLVLRI